jgi:hypothetical protein
VNKKLVLSVLSTAVVTSMAASAMAKPNAGFYVGGNVDKYYSIDAFINNLDTALDEIIDNLDSTTFVDENGKAAPFLSALNAQTEEELNAVTEPARLDHFEKNPYTIVDGTGSYNPEEDEDLLAPEPGELKVESVSAINAKTLEIKFSKAVDINTVIAGGVNGGTLSSNITISKAESSANTISSFTAELSEDGKTLTITPNTYFKGKYAVNVSTSVEDADDNPVEAFTTVVNVNDTTRPTISAPTYPANGVARFALSEPINADATAIEAAMTITDENGDVVDDTGLVTVNGNSFDLDIHSLEAGKNYTVTFIGLKDYAGNLISPNPVTFTVKNETVDSVKPAIESLVATKEGELKITFSEKVKDQGSGVIGQLTINAGTPVPINITPVSGNATVDSTGKVVTVTDSGLSGLVTVQVSGYKDLSGNEGNSVSKVLNFVADTTDPTVTNTKVETIDGVEYLVVTFNENVTPADDVDITGKVVKNFVESNVTIVTDTDSTPSAGPGEVSADVSLYKPVSGKSNSIKINLTNLTDGQYTLTLPVGLVQDEAGNDNEAKTNVTFTRGTNTVKPKLTTDGDNGIVKQDNNTYLVYFDTMLDSVTALNESNYEFEGAVVADAIFTKNDASGAIVKLTLQEGSVTVNGERAVTIKNVKSAAGVVMDTVNTTEDLTENVRPTIVKAELTDTDEITLTFSEAMQAATIADSADSAPDFEVYIGGKKATNTLVEDGTDGKVFTITLTPAFTADDLAAGIVVKAASGLDAKDANGNVINFTSITVQQ